MSGRPRKEGAEYFPHSVHGGKALAILQFHFGNDGYAVKYKTEEMLGESASHSLDYDDVNTWQYALFVYSVDEGRANEILQLLADLGEIDAELWAEKRIVWSENFIKKLEPLYAKRANPIPTKPDSSAAVVGAEVVGDISVPENGISEAVILQSIVENSKAENRRAEYTAPPNHDDEQDRGYEEIDTKNTDLLIRQISSLEPEYFPPGHPDDSEKSRWAVEFRNIRVDDGRSVEDVERILRGFPHDKFWRAHIRVPGDLRGQTRKGRDKFRTILQSVIEAEPVRLGDRERFNRLAEAAGSETKKEAGLGLPF